MTNVLYARILVHIFLTLPRHATSPISYYYPTKSHIVYTAYVLGKYKVSLRTFEFTQNRHTPHTHADRESLEPHIQNGFRYKRTQALTKFHQSI